MGARRWRPPSRQVAFVLHYLRYCRKMGMSPPAKPVAMEAEAIKDASKRNGVVLNSFGASGTTLVAAERTGRRG